MIYFCYINLLSHPNKMYKVIKEVVSEVNNRFTTAVKVMYMIGYAENHDVLSNHYFSTRPRFPQTITTAICHITIRLIRMQLYALQLTVKFTHCFPGSFNLLVYKVSSDILIGYVTIAILLADNSHENFFGIHYYVIKYTCLFFVGLQCIFCFFNRSTYGAPRKYYYVS